jgi:hypothetical protein
MQDQYKKKYSADNDRSVLFSDPRNVEPLLLQFKQHFDVLEKQFKLQDSKEKFIKELQNVNFTEKDTTSLGIYICVILDESIQQHIQAVDLREKEIQDLKTELTELSEYIADSI